MMPYFVGDILEIPLTTTQDYTLFHLLNEYSLDLWKAQTELIMEKNGLVSFIVHPDYVIEKKAQGIYRDLLSFLRQLGPGKKNLVRCAGRNRSIGGGRAAKCAWSITMVSGKSKALVPNAPNSLSPRWLEIVSSTKLRLRHLDHAGPP